MPTMTPATMAKQTSRKLIGDNVMQAIMRIIIVIIFLQQPYDANYWDGTQLINANAGSPKIAIITPPITPTTTIGGPSIINASTNINL